MASSATTDQDLPSSNQEDEVMPVRNGEFHNHHMDSTRWDSFNYRPGDVVVATYAKAGTYHCSYSGMIPVKHATVYVEY